MLTIKKFTFNPLAENSYVIFDEEKNCAIIDPGCSDAGERTVLENFINENKLTPVLFLNTHCHFDHVFGNNFVFEKWKLPLHFHQDDKHFLAKASEYAGIWGFTCENFSGDFVFIDEKKELKIGNETLKIFHTPGHSQGSVSFYNTENNFVISGDVLFNNSIGRTDLPGGDFDTLMHSIKTKLFTLPDETIVYCGHGENTTIGYEKETNPFING